MRSSEGSIVKLGDRHYRVRVTVGYSPKTGRQVRTSRTVRGTLREAEAMRDRLLRDAGGATSVLYGKMSVSAFVEEEWLPTRKLRPTTRAGYDSIIATHIKPLFSTVTVEGLTPLYVSKMLASIARPGAALNTYKMLRSAMNLAVDSDIIRKNPLNRVSPPELAEYQAQTYTLGELVTVLAHVRGAVIEPGILIAATCGLRASETCALDWRSLTLERTDEGFSGHVSVEQGYHRVRGERITTEPKSKRSKRVVAIPGFAVERLMEIRGLGPLMVDRTGQRMTPGGFTSRWRRLILPRRNKAGELIYEPPVRYIELKNLRHSQSTILLDLGATMHEVSLRDGHASEQVTDQFYNKAHRKTADHSVAERFDKAVRRA